MKEADKTKAQFIEELTQLRHRVAQLEVSESECKREVKELRENEDRYRTMVEIAKDSVIMVQGEGKISYWNPAAEELFGYSSREVIGKELLNIIPERYHENVRKGFSVFRETGLGPAVGRLVESEAIKKNGTEFSVEISVSAAKIKGQWLAVGIVRDITDRRRGEALLRESWMRYRVLLEIERDPIMLIDFESGNLLEVNRAAELLYGYSREEFLKMKAADLCAETEKTDFRFRKLENQSAGRSPILTHKKKNGSLFSVEISACMFMWKNRKTSYERLRKIDERNQEQITDLKRISA